MVKISKTALLVAIVAAGLLVLSGCSSSGNAASASYRQSVKAETDTMARSSSTIAALFRAARPDDPTWKQRVFSELSTWHSIRTEAEQLSPPACLAPAQTRWVAALQQMDAAGDLFRQGLTSGDTATVSTGFDRVSQSNDQLDAANRLVKSASC